MENEASKEDKDKTTETEMEKSVNNQDVKIGSAETGRGSSQSQPKNDAPYTKVKHLNQCLCSINVYSLYNWNNYVPHLRFQVVREIF